MLYTCNSTMVQLNCKFMKKIILASTSPRRKEILKAIGLKFLAVDSGYAENMNLNLEPRKLAEHLSRGKALALKDKYNNHIIIGADTFVVLNNELLGKAMDDAQVKEMLYIIRNKKIEVITGFTIIDTASNKIISKSVRTILQMKDLTDSQINNYVKSCEGIGKAGGFAIQGLGALLVEKIDGDYLNIVGLPLSKVSESLQEFGISIL